MNLQCFPLRTADWDYSAQNMYGGLYWHTQLARGPDGYFGGSFLQHRLPSGLIFQTGFIILGEVI